MAQAKQQELSDRAFELLEFPEKFNLIFVDDANDVSPEHLVALANSNNGGTLLIGVSESSNDSGEKIGKTNGCLVDAAAIQFLMDVGKDCLPEMKLDINTEQLDGKSFIRIELADGSPKPFCTQCGRYVIYSGKEIRALTPDELIVLCSDKETVSENSASEHILEVIQSVEKDVYEGNVGTGKNFDELNSVLDAILHKLDIEDPNLELKKETIQSEGTLRMLEGVPIEVVIDEFHKKYRHLDKKLIEGWLSETGDLFGSDN